jgi:hypothetical protein
MRQQNRRILGAIGGAALLCGAFGGATASAQAMPPPPVIVPSAGGCVFVADIGSCIGVVMPVTPPTAGIVPLGPLGESREGRVDVDRDVDSSRRPGQVIVR